jgi:phosphate transport system substrate-binding protein
MRKFLGAAIIALTTISTANAADLTLHGSTTVAANVFKPFQAKLESVTGLKLNVVGNGSSRGVAGLVSGKADIGMISSSVESMKKKIPDADWGAIKSHEVGIARIAFIVHKDNNVSNLTLEQIKSILLGDIINWSDVGGANQPIIIISEYSGGGIRSTIEKVLLDKQSLKGKIKELANAPQVIKVTSQLKNAIGLASGVTINASIKEIQTDSNLEQPLILLTKGDPNANAVKLIDAIKALNIK